MPLLLVGAPLIALFWPPKKGRSRARRAIEAFGCAIVLSLVLIVAKLLLNAQVAADQTRMSSESKSQTRQDAFWQLGFEEGRSADHASWVALYADGPSALLHLELFSVSKQPPKEVALAFDQADKTTRTHMAQRYASGYAAGMRSTPEGAELLREEASILSALRSAGEEARRHRDRVLKLGRVDSEARKYFEQVATQSPSRIAMAVAPELARTYTKVDPASRPWILQALNRRGTAEGALGNQFEADYFEEVIAGL